jgi:hypothetical protein
LRRPSLPLVSALVVACAFLTLGLPRSASAEQATRGSTVGASPPDRPYVVAAGDIACGDPSVDYPEPPGAFVRGPTTCHEDATAAMFAPGGMLASRELRGVLALGDLQYEYGLASEYTYRNPGCSIVPGLESGPCSFAASWAAASRAWRAFGPPAPHIYPTPGNHEYQPGGGSCRLVGLDANACGYNRYFGDSIAVPGPWQAGDGRGSYAVRFDLDAPHPILFLSLNVGQCDRDVTACAADSELIRFATRVLSSKKLNPPPGCAVVYYHQPAWDHYMHGNLWYVAPVWRALLSADIRMVQRPDLVVNGHNHIYERYEPLNATGRPAENEPGIPQITVGTGGKDVGWEPARLPRERTRRPAAADLLHFGVEKLAWSPDRGRITASFYREGDPTPFDPATYRCHGAGL